ncbi:hypothetical protein ABVN80_10260 [Acinetobacter baumannii]
MIGFGAYLYYFRLSRSAKRVFRQIYGNTVLLPHGIHGFIMALAVIMFCIRWSRAYRYCSAETKKPETTIQRQ